MLTIPSDVKALFQRDIVHKNFHVHFPNGETSDLNNEDIVEDSVVFTESICSQQYFKFGLAESSEIDFTCVNVPNIKGVTIQCAIEIDVSSLGASFIEDNPVDTTLPFLTPQTIQWDDLRYAYRVPYGEFIVDECPRDNGAMYQRQVTAYTAMISDDDRQMNKYFVDALAIQRPDDKSYNINLANVVYSALGRNDPNVLTVGGFSGTSFASWKTELTPSTQPTRIYNEIWAKNKTTGDYVKCTVYLGVSYASFPASNKSKKNIDGTYIGIRQDKIVTFENNGYSVKNIKNLIDSFNENYDFSHQFGPTPTTPPSPSSFIYPVIEQSRWQPQAELNETMYFGSSIYKMDTEQEVIYAFRNIGSFSSIRMPWYISIELIDPTTEEQIEIAVADERASLVDRADALYWERTAANMLDGLAMKLKNTAKATVTKSVDGRNKKVPVYSYTGSFSYPDLVTGLFELEGKFLAPAREGGLKFLILDDSAPVSVSSNDWAEFWWDESEISPIGSVTVAYNDGKKEQTSTITVNEEGFSVYDMTDNEVLKKVELKEADVTQILTESFLQNASAINFTPIDLEMRGLPYLETGDYITLTAKDGATVSSYILQQEIQGIQHLRSIISSTNGRLEEIVDE